MLPGQDTILLLPWQGQPFQAAHTLARSSDLQPARWDYLVLALL